VTSFDDSKPVRHVAVIGAGLSGLTAALRLQQRGFETTIFEATDAPGGRASSVAKDGFIVDTGATALATSYDSYLPLIEELGLSDEVIAQCSVMGVLRGDKVHLLDMKDPTAGLRTGLLSIGSKLKLVRVLIDAFKAKRAGMLKNSDMYRAAPLDVESASEYTLRKLNKEVLDYLVSPIVRIMLMTDPYKATKVELLSGISNVFGSKIMALKGGVGHLANVMASQLKPLYNSPVTAIRESSGGVEIDFKQNGLNETQAFDAAVVATTLPVAIDICDGAYAPLTKLASTLKYVPGLTVGVAMKRKPDSPAFAVLVPSVEDSDIALAFLDHNKSPDRAPEGKGLVDFHWETSAAARMANASDEQIIARTMEMTRRLFPEVAEDDIEFAHVTRWSAALPFTSVGSYRAIGEFVRTMDHKGRVHFAGDYMSMAGQNTAVEMGNRAASRIDKIFNGTSQA